MARPRSTKPVKLFAGLLGGDPDLLRRTRQLLGRRFGPIDLESELWPFDQTDYYEPEMGPHLQRWFLSFENPIPPDRLAEIKHETNALEAEIAEDCLLPDIPRPVNIDPGYLDLNKLVLGTTKDSSHRICLGSGIYAEVTLRYRHGSWQTLPWTYPDYTRPEYHAFFNQVRERLREQRNTWADRPDNLRQGQR
ncbi:MAG: DUF4416 family protein [Phycisphaerae bacterium]|nr:DUF4416 family protein [Phycisphaerae bacterium]